MILNGLGLGFACVRGAELQDGWVAWWPWGLVGWQGRGGLRGTGWLQKRGTKRLGRSRLRIWLSFGLGLTNGLRLRLGVASWLGLGLDVGLEFRGRVRVGPRVRVAVMVRDRVRVEVRANPIEK